MPKIFDEIIEYSGWFPKIGGKCRLRVYEHNNNAIVIASELITPEGDYEQDGVSITNAAEKIATKVRTEIGFGWDVWIEHYPPRGNHGFHADETFDYVEFTVWTGIEYRTPEWKHTTKEVVERWIGEELEPMDKVKK